MDNSLSIQFEVNQEDIDFLWNGIIEYNKQVGPMLKYPPYEPFRIIIRNEDNDIIAGILTKIYLRCMFVELLWIDSNYRKKGIGTELLNRVEKYAKESGCIFIHLDTFSFQAIEFYKRYGYKVICTIDDYPDNIKRFYLKKYL